MLVYELIVFVGLKKINCKEINFVVNICIVIMFYFGFILNVCGFKRGFNFL